MIYVVKNPRHPQFRFEWHEQAKRVYLVRLEVLPHMGDPIAFDIADHGAAINAVMIWCRGYNAAKAETAILGDNSHERRADHHQFGQTA